ncbi:MAG: ankyrin repeat domain-containing protein, partial [Acidobacteriota bacterium]
MRPPFKTILLLLPLIFAQAAFGDINSDLIEAAEAGDTAKVEQLIEQGADVNAEDKYGITALMFAAKNGQTEIVKALVDAGADVEAKDKYGVTALMAAASGSHTETVKVLIDAGADANIKSPALYGITAL